MSAGRRFPTPNAFMGDRPVVVELVGAGGTGSMFADGLARLDCALRSQGHAGMRVTIHDDATVREANIGRQRFTRSDVGFHKATLLVHRINAFYGLNWKESVTRLTRVDERADLVIGCVDLGKFRFELGKSNRKRSTNCLWLDTGNGESTGQVVLGHLGKPREGLRLPNVYDFYGEALLTADDDDLPSCSLAEALSRQRWSINPMVATTALALLDSLFHRGGLDDHGAWVKLDPVTVTPLQIDPVMWGMLGYG